VDVEDIVIDQSTSMWRLTSTSTWTGR